jgi:hypothetical protein
MRNLSGVKTSKELVRFQDQLDISGDTDKKFESSPDQ